MGPAHVDAYPIALREQPNFKHNFNRQGKMMGSIFRREELNISRALSTANRYSRCVPTLIKRKLLTHCRYCLLYYLLVLTHETDQKKEKLILFNLTVS